MSYKTFYSIIYLIPYPTTNERLNLGLFLSDGKKILFDYAEERVQIISKLIGTHVKSDIKQILRNLKNEFTDANNELTSLFLAEEWSESRFSYLSRYSTNLIGFTKVEEIQLPISQELFDRLYKKWVFTHDTASHSNEESIEIRLRPFIERALGTCTNLNLKVTSSMVPGLIFPVNISSIGQNKSPFICEFIDFNQSLNTVKSRISNVIQLNQAFSANKKRNAAIYFVSNEPEKQDSSHSIWKNLNEWSDVSMISEQEVEIIEEYVKSHNVQPLVNTFSLKP